MTSQIKTVLLLGLMTALIIFIGGAFGGRVGLFIALFLALAMNVGSYWFSDKIVLSMYRAREVGPEDAPALHSIVAELAHNAEIPKPRICIVPEETPNAFATGRNPEHGVVCVTQGILRLLDADELRGVLAHELGHIKNRDILISSIAGVMASVVMYLATMAQWAAIFGIGGGDDEEGGSNPLAALLIALVAPMAAMLIQMGISRSREYLADQTGARVSHKPLALANALQKIQGYSRQVPMHHGNEATAHMFIINPFSASKMANLFSTHPPTEERIKRLQAMASSM